MTGTPSRTARVPIARWDLKEAVGKLRPEAHEPHVRQCRVGEEASVSEARCHPERDWCICGGDGRKVTRLTLGDLSTCLVLGRPRGRPMGGQKSAEGDKERRSDPRPEQ